MATLEKVAVPVKVGLARLAFSGSEPPPPPLLGLVIVMELIGY
jgi:hypothetical protein